MSKQSFKDMATRADNAVIAWRDMLADYGFNANQADSILRLYKQ